MTNREALAWLIVGLLLGIILGLLISNANRPQPPCPDDAAARPVPDAGRDGADNIRILDPRREVG